MLISPPFLPQDALKPSDLVSTDPMMDWVDWYEPGHHGIYPIAFDRRWHGGMHLCPRYQNEPVRAIADGEVVAYRVCQKPITQGDRIETSDEPPRSNAGFVLLRHRTETDEGRAMTFYSLYMHLLDLSSYLGIGVIPTNPPEVGSASVLPRWLCFPTDGVVAPTGMKVYRKDILGYPGSCDGIQHLHFEIFMTEEDFAAWFDRPGNDARAVPNPVTPNAKEYWGHGYFVIPGGKRFVSLPPGLSRNTARYFPALDDGALDDASTLYVEVYFHKGQRYSRSWLERDGKITELTPSPVRDSYDDYEYKLYDRSVALYPACPSDGYELLRFGRILSDQPTLAADDRKTWVAVTFETGRQGYIDISQPSIQKLSDADFPAFMGWLKVHETNSPFDEDGLCDYEPLVRLVQVEDEAGPLRRTAREEGQPKDPVIPYIRNSDAVRAKLRGLICHAPSEWDASNNEARFQRLKAPDEFFGRRIKFDPNGYDNFLRHLQKLQFLAQTPLGEGKKFWYFHPMAFIRHFRRCGWLSAEELAQCFPRTLLHLHGHRFKSSVTPWNIAENSAQRWAVPLNKTIRKYGIAGRPFRLLHLLSQVIPETRSMNLVKEQGGEHMAYNPYYGRGLIQLTFLENYQRYGTFRGFRVGSELPREFAALGWDPNLLLAADNRGNHHPENCADSAGFYVVQKRRMLSHMDAGAAQEHTISVSKDVNGYVAIENLNGLEVRLQSAIYLQMILLDTVFTDATANLRFDWRRSSVAESVVNADGAVIRKKFYVSRHSVSVALDRQKPGHTP